MRRIGSARSFRASEAPRREYLSPSSATAGHATVDCAADRSRYATSGVCAEVVRSMRAAAFHVVRCGFGSRWGATICAAVWSVTLASCPTVGATAMSKWSFHRVPHPAGASSSFLGDVSCRSSTACTAVGFSERNDTELALAERWNGSQWSIQPTSSPAGSTGSGLNSVSCPTTRACTAVGTYADQAGNTLALAERWNGSSWSIQPVLTPVGATGSSLTGVSCPSETTCTAVGEFDGRDNNEWTLAERWQQANGQYSPLS